MGRAEGILRRRDAALERAGRCRARLFGGGVPRGGDRAPPQGKRPHPGHGRALLPCSSRRGGPLVSGGIERKVPRAPGGPHGRNSDVVQRSVRDASHLLSRGEGSLLLRSRGQGDPCGASGAPESGPSGIGRVRGLRLRLRQPLALPGRLRAPGRRGVDLPRWLGRTEEGILSAPSVGGTGSPGAGTILPRGSRHFLAEPPSVFRGAGAYRHVLDRRTGHTHDDGLAEGSPGISSVLHLRGNVPRLSGRPRRTTSGPRVRAVSRGDRGGRGLPCPFSLLRRAHGVPHGRMRRGEPCSGPLPERDGPNDRPHQDNGELWG